MASDNKTQKDDDNNGSGGWGVFSTIFNKTKMGEVAWTCISIGALLFVFILMYTLLAGATKFEVLSKTEIRFAFWFSIGTLLYAFLYTSIKDIVLGTKTDTNTSS